MIRKYSVRPEIPRECVCRLVARGTCRRLWHAARMRKPSSSSIALRTIGCLLVDVLRFVSLGFRSRSQPAAENLYLRKQLALYAERGVRPRRADDATWVTLVVLARLIDWRAALTIVNRTRSFAGIARDSASFGGGSHRRAGGRRSRSTCSA